MYVHEKNYVGGNIHEKNMIEAVKLQCTCIFLHVGAVYVHVGCMITRSRMKKQMLITVASTRLPQFACYYTVASCTCMALVH